MDIRVLFVDDDRLLLRAMERTLRGQCPAWDLRFLDSGAAAVELLRRETIDVVFCDMKMPGVDGTEVLERARQIQPRAVRALLSGFDDQEHALRAVPVAHQFLRKPFDTATVRALVQRAASLNEQLADDRLGSLLGALGPVPALPRVYMELTEALARREPCMATVAAIVERDMAITGKLLCLVNSALFALPRRTTSVRDAVAYLGLGTLRSLVLSIETFQAFKPAVRLPALAPSILERHAMQVAQLARQLAPDGNGTDDTFLAALLHDIGKLLLAQLVPHDVARILETVRRTGAAAAEVERDVLGVTHADVGAHLLGLWGLPYPVVEAVAHHHDPAVVPHQAFEVLDAVYVANRLVGAATASVDEAHLAALGVVDKLPAWRMLADRTAMGRA